MKKTIAQFQEKSRAELAKQVLEVQKALALLQVEHRTNPPKDSNTVSKKKKELAQLLTVMNSKKE
jgi:ribosomal protein L29